jgi:hypothetical protein
MINSIVRWPCRHAVRKRCEWLASYSGVQKRVSVQFTFAAAVGGWTERVAFMSARKLLFFATFFCFYKRKLIKSFWSLFYQEKSNKQQVINN